MTNEQAIVVLNMVEAYGLADEAKQLAIKALQNEQRLEKAIHVYGRRCGKKQAILDYLRPHGTWIYTPNIPNLSEYEGITCSICGNDSIGDFDFCPHCGADMRLRGAAE